jgi:cell division protein FtsB
MLFMPRKKRREVEVPQLRKRNRWLRDLVCLASTVLCFGLGALAVAWAMPQRRCLEKHKMKLAVALKEEATVRKEKEAYEILHRALLEGDLDYLENEARDRLDRCRPGERVFRFVR